MGLLGSFFGSDQRKDLKRAKAASDAALQTGYDDAYGDYSTAEGYFQPYAESGSQSQKMWADLMGLNGPEARAAAQASYAGDPYQQNALEQSQNAMLRFGNARGWGAGKYALAGQRVATENYGNWRDQFQTGAQTGLQASNAMAGYRAGRGDLSYGYGATKAGAETNYGNAMAQSRSIGINNLLGVAGLAVNAMKPTPKLG